MTPWPLPRPRMAQLLNLGAFLCAAVYLANSPGPGSSAWCADFAPWSQASKYLGGPQEQHMQTCRLWPCALLPTSGASLQSWGHHLLHPALLVKILKSTWDYLNSDIDNAFTSPLSFKANCRIHDHLPGILKEQVLFDQCLLVLYVPLRLLIGGPEGQATVHVNLLIWQDLPENLCFACVTQWHMLMLVRRSITCFFYRLWHACTDLLKFCWGQKPTQLLWTSGAWAAFLLSWLMETPCS